MDRQCVVRDAASRPHRISRGRRGSRRSARLVCSSVARGVSESGALRVIYLDHASVEGGAELMLARMLRARPTWRGVVLVPPGPGFVFQGLPVVVNGVSQPPGLSQAGAGGIL